MVRDLIFSWRRVHCVRTCWRELVLQLFSAKNYKVLGECLVSLRNYDKANYIEDGPIDVAMLKVVKASII